MMANEKLGLKEKQNTPPGSESPEIRVGAGGP